MHPDGYPTNLKSQEKDFTIGRALSRAARLLTKRDECLSPEDISTLLDGTFDGRDREALVRHLSQCDRCCDVLLLAYEMKHEEAVFSHDTASDYCSPVARRGAELCIHEPRRPACRISTDQKDRAGARRRKRSEWALPLIVVVTTAVLLIIFTFVILRVID